LRSTSRVPSERIYEEISLSAERKSLSFESLQELTKQHHSLWVASVVPAIEASRRDPRSPNLTSKE
jgi:hypothetical protein